ncbi:DUF5615 family PIN-like protein [Leptospira sarikeiensis]|uniref:Toxin-antitoxin system, toxin component n=1 Tax=Leptospira sarikeiensis TaxID=2484943 RepID=A0A4V3JR54_9LEPT|nr:DUF5615 family PIN-like protein [Leptospira sarikeiensis]TGL58313.1 toxin-antitoxin system, toxin component [Leptospira sarikeiensis]
MPVKLLADENVDFRIIRKLRESGYKVFSILEDCRGVKDSQIVSLTYKLDCILLTLDKDFGEWVFAHKQTLNGIIFLRYHAKDFQKIPDAIATLLQNQGENLRGKFVVLTLKKVRIREIRL